MKLDGENLDLLDFLEVTLAVYAPMLVSILNDHH